MKQVLGITLMFLGFLGSTIMCDRDVCPFKSDKATYYVNAVCLIVYGFGLHLLIESL